LGTNAGWRRQELKGLGYDNIYGLDISQAMLIEAKKKNIYKKLMCVDIQQPLSVELGTYDAIICVGTFTHGHVKADALDGMLKIIKPGGYFCFTVHEGVYEEYGFEEKIRDLDTAGTWKLLDRTKVAYLYKEGIQAWLCTYLVL